MIFVTVGAQMPFDRMVRAVDEWAGREGVRNVVAQIGQTHWRPRHIAWTDSLDPAAYRERFESARVVIAHAGMGSILTALELGKPIVVMPRLASLGETRNDHQVATVRHFAAMGRVVPAADPAELLARLDEIPLRPCWRGDAAAAAGGACEACRWRRYHARGGACGHRSASAALTQALRAFIAGMPVAELPRPQPAGAPAPVA